MVIDGFFEWRHQDGKKYPYYIYPSDETVFYLGCIYNIWKNKITGEIRDTFSIITTEANQLMDYIHNSKKRMPLILQKADISEWIDPETQVGKINSLMKPFPDNLMKSHSITSDAGNTRKNRNFPEIKNKI